jgi:hypothetical protein
MLNVEGYVAEATDNIFLITNGDRTSQTPAS